MAATSLVLAREGRLQTWSEADVVSIRQRRGDSLANGAVIGLATGVGTVLVATAALRDVSEDIEPGFTALAAGIHGAAGAGIGGGIDALITREYVIFERARNAPVAVHIAPLLGAGPVASA